MSLVDRAKNICLTPNTEWPVIAAEPATPGRPDDRLRRAARGHRRDRRIHRRIDHRHALPFIGTYRVPLVTGLVVALFTFCMAIVGVFILSLIINALAPTFGGEQNSTQALKVAVYSYTPAWIAGVLADRSAARHLRHLRRLLRLVSALPRPAASDEVSGRQGRSATPPSSSSARSSCRW